MNKKQFLEISREAIHSKIYLIRGRKVMLDSDLAELYKVKTKNLTRQVRRNKDRFPEDFMFQLTREEFLRCQIVTSNERRGGRRYRPYVFTEQGVSMLSSVLTRTFKPNAEAQKTNRISSLNEVLRPGSARDRY